MSTPVYTGDLKIDSAQVKGGGGSDYATVGGMLDVNTTTFSSPADTVENTAMTYTLPSNTLNSDGKSLEVVLFGTTAATANNKTIRIYLGATLIGATGTLGWNNKSWKISVILIRDGVGTQKFLGTSTSGAGANTYVSTYGTGAEDETTDLDIKATAQNAVAAAADIVVEGMTVKVLN